MTELYVMIMPEVSHKRTVAWKLLELDPLIDWRRFFPTLELGASDYALSEPFAFLTATAIDRGKSEINWTVPYWLREHWGQLSPAFVHGLSSEKIETAFSQLPRKPRFWKYAPETIKALARIIVEEHGGEARALWHRQRPPYFRQTLLRLPNVGPGIANMAVQLVDRVFPGELLEEGGTETLNIKCDVHTRRVLYRLGVAERPTDADALAAARQLHPEYPGKLDGALWYIGYTWCHERAPQCPACHMAEVCSRRGV